MPDIWQAIALLGGGLQGRKAAEEERYAREQEAKQQALRERAMALEEASLQQQRDLANAARLQADQQFNAQMAMRQSEIVQAAMDTSINRSILEAQREQDRHWQQGPPLLPDGSPDLTTAAGQALAEQTRLNRLAYTAAGGKPTFLEMAPERVTIGRMQMQTKPMQLEAPAALPQTQASLQMSTEGQQKAMKLKKQQEAPQRHLAQPKERPVETLEQMVANLPPGAIYTPQGIMALSPMDQLAIERGRVDLQAARAGVRTAEAEATIKDIAAQLAKETAVDVAEVEKAVLQARKEFEPKVIGLQAGLTYAQKRQAELTATLLSESMPYNIREAAAKAIMAELTPSFTREELAQGRARINLSQQEIGLRAQQMANELKMFAERMGFDTRTFNDNIALEWAKVKINEDLERSNQELRRVLGTNDLSNILGNYGGVPQGGGAAPLGGTREP